MNLGAQVSDLGWTGGAMAHDGSGAGEGGPGEHHPLTLSALWRG